MEENKLSIPSKNSNKTTEAEREHQRLARNIELGFLGKLFGSQTNNIAALVISSGLLIGFIYTSAVVLWYNNDLESIKSFWAIITPLITLALGYIFGDANKKA